MNNWIGGIHHVTGMVPDGQKDVDFYTRTLGLRLVKKTINHETADSWHFFYGDYEGNAGTIMTNFFLEGVPLPPYRRGRGTLTEVGYSVAPEALPFWEQRLRAAGCVVEQRPDRFGDPILYFEDPAGMPSELVGCDDSRAPRALGDLEPGQVVRGFHGITLQSRIPELTLDFFQRLMRYEVVDRASRDARKRTRLAPPGGGPGDYVDLVEEDGAGWGKVGMGGLHHVAFTVDTKEQMEMLWQVLSGDGFIVTDLRDRKWFHSMYLTEPGGINVEFSNLEPGWTVDESLEDLGTTVSLPRQWEAKREEIVAKLPPIRL